MNNMNRLLGLLYIWLLLSFGTLAWNDGDNGMVAWDMNCDFPGHDVFKTNSLGQNCGRLCIYNRQCAFFTWSNGNCYLKNYQHQSDRTTWVSGAVCGFVKGREKMQNLPTNTFGQMPFGFLPH